jgi:hypothetical protein
MVMVAEGLVVFFWFLKKEQSLALCCEAVLR